VRALQFELRFKVVEPGLVDDTLGALAERRKV
jgi:hypothetical protein